MSVWLAQQVNGVIKQYSYSQPRSTGDFTQVCDQGFRLKHVGSMVTGMIGYESLSVTEYGCLKGEVRQVATSMFQWLVAVSDPWLPI